MDKETDLNINEAEIDLIFAFSKFLCKVLERVEESAESNCSTDQETTN